MATNIDSALVPMEIQEGPDIEIEIEDPEAVRIGIDGLEIELSKESPEEEFDANLAEFMDESALQGLASELIELVDADMNSRKDWT
jgi:hypothetical protein